MQTFKLVASYDTDDSDSVEMAVTGAIAATGSTLRQLDSFDITPKRTTSYQNMRQQQQQQKPTRVESLAMDLVDALLEGRDDVTKLGLPKGAVAYARRTSKSMSRQPQQWANVQMSILNRGTPRKGFTCMDGGSTTSGASVKGAGVRFPKS